MKLQELKKQLSNAEGAVNDIECKIQVEYDKKFENWEELTTLLGNVEDLNNYSYIRCGELQNEVEYIFDASDIVDELESNELKYLDEYISCNFPYWLDIKEKHIVSSDVECNFILNNRDGENVLTANGDFIKYYSDFHAFLITEKSREESGVFGSLYVVDYYGGCKIYETDHTEKAIMRYCGEDKIEKINILLDYFNNNSMYITIDKTIEDFFIDEYNLYDSDITNNNNKQVIITYKVDIDVDEYTDSYLQDIKKHGVCFEKIDDEITRLTIKKTLDF